MTEVRPSAAGDRSADVPADLAAYLTAYGDAASRFDAAASAALWGEPGMIINDEFAGALQTRDEMAQGLSSSHPLYRALGLTRMDHSVLAWEPITDRLLRVRVRWHFFGGDEHLTDSDYEYLLRREPDGLRAYVAVGIDDMATLAELAARKGIDLTAPPPPE